MPKLTFWHLQGTMHGQAEKVMRDGHVVMAWGTFDETPFAQKCLKFYSKNKGQIKLSLGAYVPKWARKLDPEIRGRLFTDYNAIHITTLPPRLAMAANPFTTFDEDMVMALRPEQKEFLVKEFGQAEADRIEQANATLNETLGEIVKYKDFADLITKQDEKPADVTNKTAASLYSDLIQDQGLVLKIAQGVAKHQTEIDAKIETIEKQHALELKAAQDTIAALRKEADEFRAFMSLTPRRAAGDPATALTPEQAAEVQKQIPTEAEPFWGALGVPKEVK